MNLINKYFIYYSGIKYIIITILGGLRKIIYNFYFFIIFIFDLAGRVYILRLKL
jgi:hypothetical protein